MLIEREITNTLKLVEGKSNSFDNEVGSGPEINFFNQCEWITPIITVRRIKFHS